MATSSASADWRPIPEKPTSSAKRTAYEPLDIYFLYAFIIDRKLLLLLLLFRIWFLNIVYAGVRFWRFSIARISIFNFSEL